MVPRTKKKPTELSIKKPDYFFRPFYKTHDSSKGVGIVPNLPRHINIIGCGGNGAYLVPLIARFISQSPSDMIRNIGITLIDGDNVEEKNVLRQNFTPAEIGMNKAEALADRCNMALGMNVEAIPEYLTGTVLNRIVSRDYNGTLIIACVDRHEVRNLIAQTVEHQKGIFYIDVGNELEAGQLFLSGSVMKRGNKSRGSYNWSTVGDILINSFYPEIGKTDIKKASPSCDVNTASGRQKMVVNVKAATLAFEAFEMCMSPAEIPFYEITFGPGATRTYRISDLTVNEVADGRKMFNRVDKTP